MDLRLSIGVNFPVKKIHYKDLYNELCKIDIPEVSIVYEEIGLNNQREIYIHSFSAIPTGKGYGTKAMKEIIKITNKLKIIISLSPKKEQKVLTFWNRLGFSKGQYLYYFKYYDGYTINLDKSEKKKKTFFEKLRYIFKRKK